jgi:maltose/moltooligosaccharide transporter
MALFHNTKAVLISMSIAGIGWASLLALPFAMLSKYIKKGTEGSVMGIFNIFIAGPQVFVCTLVAWFVSQCSFKQISGVNYHWEYTFFIGAICLLVSAIIAQKVKEEE